MMSTALAQSPLLGFNIALTGLDESEIAALLRSRGARVTKTPLVQAVPAESNMRLRTALRHCIVHPSDYVFVDGATGWQRLSEVARAWRLLPALLASLDAAMIVVEDPAVAASMRADGLARIQTFPIGGDNDAVGWLLDRNLAGRRVMVVRHDVAHSHLVASLRTRRVKTTVVQTLRLGPPNGLAAVRRLVGMVIQREVHALIFSGVLPLDLLVGVADRMGRRDELLLAFASDVLAVCDEAEHPGPARSPEIPAIWTAAGRPEELAERLCVELVARRREFDAAGRRFAVQGDVLITEGTSTLLEPGPATVLRALAGHPGAILSRAAIARLSASPHGLSGVDVVVQRLRAGLGEHHWLVSTVQRRGYRLDV